MISSLNKTIPNINFTVLTSNSINTSQLHNVNTVEYPIRCSIKDNIVKGIIKGKIFNIFRNINKSDVVILGGGSLLQDLKIYYLPILYSILIYAQLKKKISVVYGIGAGPIDTKFGKIITRIVLNRTSLVTVRDSMSYTVLKKCKVNNVTQTVDPAFGIELDKKIYNNIYNNSIISSTLYNGLQDSDINKNTTNENDKYDERCKIIAEVYYTLCNKGKNIILLPTVDTDKKVYSTISNIINDDCSLTIAEYRNDFNYYYSIISSSYLLLGMRLHSMIMATILGIPFIPISYSGKVKSYLELLELSDLYIDIENISSDNFIELLMNNYEKVYTNREYYSNYLLHKAYKLNDIALSNAILLKKLLDVEK